ncbi:zinc finger protein 75D-like [Tenrec ecaudatus]|uniref:zinc finger protein 75D-like n=1 Tax=Tenrec ecaudatus TaxID=94439 RepID=UPI003F5AA245
MSQVAPGVVTPREEFSCSPRQILMGDTEVAADQIRQLRPRLGLKQSMKHTSNQGEKVTPLSNGLDPESSRQQFRAFCPAATAPLQVVSELQELCRWWLRPESHSKELILEMLVLEQFLALLPRKLQIQMQKHRPQSIQEAVALVELFRGKFGPRRKESLLTFEDVTLIFSEEEWELLDFDQKALYSSVMQDTYESVLSLGSKIRNHPQNDLAVPPPELEIQEPEGSVSKKAKMDAPQKTSVTEYHGDIVRVLTQHQNFPGKKGKKNSSCNLDLPRCTDLQNKSALGERTYKCQECGASFLESSDLNNHQRIHNEEKPYRCQHCDRRFRLNSYLKKHLMTHQIIISHKCSWCGKSFIRKLDLHRHHRIHTGEKPFECQECGRRFTQKSILTDHQRTHTGEHPYSCSTCKRKFCRRSSLLSHQKKHHRPKEDCPMTAD